jgi:hypothetical protein
VIRPPRTLLTRGGPPRERFRPRQGHEEELPRREREWLGAGEGEALWSAMIIKPKRWKIEVSLVLDLFFRSNLGGMRALFIDLLLRNVFQVLCFHSQTQLF